MDTDKQQAVPVSDAPITQEELKVARKFLTNCTLVVNNHKLANDIKNGTLTQDKFTDLCKYFELSGYDMLTTQFTVRVDTHMRNEVMISQVPAFANRHTRRMAARMERKDARKR
jgi:hypothetical protein